MRDFKPTPDPEMWETTLLLVAGWLQSFLVTTVQVNNVKKTANLNPHLQDSSDHIPRVWNKLSMEFWW